MICLAVFYNAQIWTVFTAYNHCSVLTREMGIPPELKRFAKFLLEKESLRLFIIYTDGRKMEYRYSLKKDKVAKVLILFEVGAG